MINVLQTLVGTDAGVIPRDIVCRDLGLPCLDVVDFEWQASLRLHLFTN